MGEVKQLPHHSKRSRDEYATEREMESLWASDLGNTVTGPYMGHDAQIVL